MNAKKQMGTLDVRINPDLKTAILVLAKGQRGELEMRVELAKKKNEVEVLKKFEEFLLKHRLKLKTPSPSKRR